MNRVRQPFNVNDLSMTLYPAESEMMMMSFNQVYESSNYSNITSKTLLWKKDETGIWKIIFEG